jgi:hypothetical protein
MFRFTIRDVLWLTVVVAMGAGWWADRTAKIVEGRRRWWNLRNTTAESAREIGIEVRDLGHGKIKFVSPSSEPTSSPEN